MLKRSHMHQGGGAAGAPSRPSQYEGVQWSQLHAKWHAYFVEDGHYVDLGLFQIEEDAARAVETAEFVSSCSVSEDSSTIEAWPAHLPLKRARADPERSSESDQQSGRSHHAPRPPPLALAYGDAFHTSPPASPATRPFETSPKPRSRPRISRPNSASSTRQRLSPEEHAYEPVKTKKQQSQFVGV
jgi:hypothetical protein